jgi:hypothetical protein
MLLSLHRAAATAALLVCVCLPWVTWAEQESPPVPSATEPAATTPLPPAEPPPAAEPALPSATDTAVAAPATSPPAATTPAAKVVLLPVEFTVYQLGVAGPEAVPDWTASARRNLDEALRVALQGRTGLEIVPLPELTAEEQKVLDAHIGVARLIVYEGSHMGGKVWALRRAEFDRHLGPGLVWLRDRSGADYGVLVAGSQAEQSGGLVFAQVLAAASGYIISPGGGTNISTALINLGTGEVTWFNSTFATEVLGISKVDFRKVESSAEVLRELMAPYPRIPSLEVTP